MRPLLSTFYLVVFLSGQLAAQSYLGTESIFRTLQQYDPLHITIETDFKQLRSDKADETWQPAVFSVTKGDSVVLRLDVQVAARGNMRKKTCDFPPIKIKFTEEEDANDSIADINELKLVTSCHKNTQNEEWVQKEYVTYQLYNLLTEQSFRVKAANVKIVSPEKKNSPVESFAFFIENEKELAARLNGVPMKPKIVSTKILDEAGYARMCLFQFMIGNTDWSVRTRHNVKAIYSRDSQLAIPVPYDFDYSGVVFTDYAAPSTDVPIQSVTDRYYLGPCHSEEYYQKLFDSFLSQKTALIEQCEQSEHLPKSAKRQMTLYIEGFYKILENPKTARREIVRHCDKAR